MTASPESLAVSRAYRKGAAMARSRRAKERRGVSLITVNPYREAALAMAWGRGFSETYWPSA